MKATPEAQLPTGVVQKSHNHQLHKHNCQPKCDIGVGSEAQMVIRSIGVVLLYTTMSMATLSCPTPAGTNGGESKHNPSPTRLPPHDFATA